MTGRIYLDSNIIIYYVEGNPTIHNAVETVLMAYIKDDARFVTSEITIGECLIGIGKRSDSDQAEYLKHLDDEAFISLVPVTGDIIRRAALIGSSLNMKLVDAIHVATAEACGCGVFMTNDRGIRAPAAIELRYPPGIT